MIEPGVTLRPDLPLVEVTSAEHWRDWLENNHEQRTGVWVVTYKKPHVPAGLDYVSIGDLNGQCLCFGWIDSKTARIDEQRSALLCTPRKRGSGWSKVNKERIEQLIADDLMAPAGLALIEAAKLDGSWSKLDQVDALIEPPDLAAALDANPDSRRHWDGFPPSTRRAILEWISTARRQATRQSRITSTAELAAVNRRANEWPRR